jgi:response regulator RpfG family c-di-GMP phosphodiesterase
MTTNAAQKNDVFTVLFVDDEPNILRAIKRALFTLDINMLLADSGMKALELMEQQDVHVVISDMKMPQMSGAELLEQVATRYPDTFRVVLTGYADIESTIKAVNQGKIHRYLQKPWDNQELISVVEEGLERVKLKTENMRLQTLTRMQNRKLKDVNATLEQVVHKRTRQIKAALNKIEKHNLAM